MINVKGGDCMNKRIVALVLLVAVVAFVATAVPSIQGDIEIEGNRTLTASHGLVSADNGAGNVPLGDPIDTPGMPT
jgi:hypothetical protein